MIDQAISKLTFEEMWAGVVTRDKAHDGLYWIGVLTTGIYCRPGCPARTPKRENVRFFEKIVTARAAGLRACKRCKPDEASLVDQQGAVIERAIRQIQHSVEQGEEPPQLNDLAARADLSPWHFHRVFKAHTGLTPKKYISAVRSGKLQAVLEAGMPVTQAVYEAGYSAPSRMYEEAGNRLGMKPSQRRKKGEGMILRYDIADCWLGRVLVAATDQGICCIQLGLDDAAMTKELQNRFPKAALEKAQAGSGYAGWISQTVAAIEKPEIVSSLPLDIRGTAFQEQVWQALQTIPAGQTMTYSDLANQIGKPNAVRAVGTACGANKLAVIIPCHRVIGKDGKLTGYRWGTDIKAKLLAYEQGV